MSFASFHNPIVARTYREGVHGWFAVASVLTAVTIALGCGGDTDLSACILPPPTDRLEVRQLTYVKASVGAGTESAFGAGVSLSADGSTLAVGAPYDPSGALGVNADPTDRSRTDAGAAHVFVRSGVTWVQEAYLKPANAHAAVEFGRLVSLSKTGDTLIVGVPQDSDPKFSGSAVVFRRVGGRWTEEGYLRSSLGGSGGQFGVSVALSDEGDTAVVGALHSAGHGTAGCEFATGAKDLCRGAAYVFERTNGRWEERAILRPPEWMSLPYPVLDALLMGTVVRVSGDGNVVAALATGTLLTFTRGPKWMFEASTALPAPRHDPDPLIGFGPRGGYSITPMSLAISSDGSTLAVGEPEPPARGETFASRVEVFARRDGNLSKTATVQPLASRPDAKFGWRVALSGAGERLAVGAYADSGGQGGTNPNPCASTVEGAGAAYLFALEGATWKERAFLKARRVNQAANFGRSVALDALGATLVVGAPGDPSNASGIDGDESDTSTPYAGATYVFR